RPVVGHDEAQAARSAGRQRRGFHDNTPALADFPGLRWRARLSARSRASFRRYDSPSIEMTSARCTRRSTSETTQAALGNTSCHSANGRFDVTIVLLFWYLRLI